MITLLLLVRATYMYGVVLHAHPVRGESHNQRNTTERLQQYNHLRPDSPSFLKLFSECWPVAPFNQVSTLTQTSGYANDYN